MPNAWFQFKQFTVCQDRCAMKVTTDSCLFGSWAAAEIRMQTYEKERAFLLDIGTGTGLLSLMIAQQNDLSIDAVEIEMAAAMQARENIDRSPWKDRIRIQNDDITVMDLEKQYDFIICNPPFYQNELHSPREKKNLAHHSSHLNLDQLVDVMHKGLKESGRFFLLLPYKRMEEAEAIFNRNGLFIGKKRFVKQSLRHAPFRCMIMGSKKDSGNAQVSEMAIRDANDQYTDEFKELLKPYYLHL